MFKSNKISQSNQLQILIIFSVLFCFSNSATAQLYFPNSNYYHSEIERFNLNNLETSNFQQHLTSKPLLDTKTNVDSIYHSDGKYYYWITQKLFKENFIIFKGDNFWCSVDPIIDAQLGTDFSLDSTYKMYWNTRGIRVQAKFFNNVAFTTSVYENQIIVPTYQSDFFDAHGEFRPTNNGYKQGNGFVPMYARTKPFKVNGYDFAFAEGNLSIIVNKNLNFNLGNGNQFIGDGYRSLFLSDFSGNYPFFKTELFALDGKLQYNLIYASLTNPYRLKTYSTPEAIYERKISTFHFLDYNITKHININLFEGSQWRSTDSSGTHSPDYLFLNPIIGVNSLIKGTEALNYNSIFGIGASTTFKSNKLYSQIVIDNKTISAFQIGVKTYDFFIKKLDLRFEYNSAINNSYLSQQVRYNYSHNNLPLAHPFVGGFKELIAIIDYQKDRFFVQNKLVFYSHSTNDSLNIGTNILQSSSTISTLQGVSNNIINNRFEIGYRFNKNYNLQVLVGYLYRQENIKNNPQKTQYVYFGFRTRLRNKKLDW